MKKSLSIILALIMLLTAAPLTVFADSDAEYYKNKYFEGLADPTYTKKTENYDGYHLVKGTKATWDCKLYTLSAKVTGVSGSKATINVTFNSKIPYEYLQKGALYDYEVKAFSNTQTGSYSFYPSEKSSMTFTVDTSKKDNLSGSSAAGGLQFVKFEVLKYEHAHYYLYGDNPYYSAIADFAKKSDRRSIEGTYDQRIDDTWALSYYVTPDYHIYKNNYKITKDSITLGTYAFESIVQYRKKGASSYKQKTFKKSKKMYLSSLKAGTTYQIHPLCKVYFTSPEPKTDGISVQKGYILDQVASPFYLTTSLSSKPKVTSVKVSKFKNGKKKTIPGYWESDGDWHPTETFNTATYTMTVKVKSPPSRAKGLVLKIGGSTYYATGNKKTYTFKLYYQDKKKISGKKMKANFYWSSNTISKSPLGLSPAKSASYKIKNGTYKVK
ncbi:MAG: hypothetical protein IKN26_01300 [Eubacterium sp.]|nr:hypothetical protein [Eubacterium sp.]MBR4241004.1 hypothetical protein [Eubacterium sp.]